MITATGRYFCITFLYGETGAYEGFIAIFSGRDETGTLPYLWGGEEWFEILGRRVAEKLNV